MLGATFEGGLAKHKSFVGQVGHGRSKRAVLAPYHSEVQVFALGSRLCAKVKRLSLQFPKPSLLLTLDSFLSISLFLENALLLCSFFLENIVKAHVEVLVEFGHLLVKAPCNFESAHQSVLGESMLLLGLVHSVTPNGLSDFVVVEHPLLHTPLLLWTVHHPH